MATVQYAPPIKYLIDAGLLTVGGTTAVFGATVGGLKFAVGNEIRHVQFDGLRFEIEGQHRNTGGAPLISGKVLTFADANVISMHPGSYSDGSSGTNTITLQAADLFWASGAYLSNVYYIGRRQDNKVFRVRMARAYIKNSGFQSQDKNEVGWDIEVVPVLPVGVTDIAQPPYTYEIVD